MIIHWGADREILPSSHYLTKDAMARLRIGTIAGWFIHPTGLEPGKINLSPEPFFGIQEGSIGKSINID
jgi:hypothetical protein